LVAKMNLTAAAKRITLSYEIRPDLPEVALDEHRITQVLTNLVNNAFKFTPEGGAVVIKVSAFEPQPEFICVSVRDTGRGIPQEHQTHIFERLFQIKNGDATSEQGFGLGLYLCQELVQLHGGRIWAQSEPGKGSTFSFVIPRQASQQARVLVIDDDPEVGRCVRAILERDGFQVTTCQSGAEGLQFMRQQRPELVILDLDMPDMDGAEVLKQVRRDWELIPVIVHTGYPESALMVRALESSPFTLLAKPAEATQLLAAVRGTRIKTDTSFWIGPPQPKRPKQHESTPSI
jgi:CheY-like chemotaxis protein